MRRLALSLAALAVLALPAAAQDVLPRRASITVSGAGMVSARPDMALVNSAVVTEGKTAREALDANTAAMEKVLAGYRAANLEERDIATSGFTIQPRYVYPERKNNSPEAAPRITGYEVRNEVRVRVRDLGKLGDVLDSAVTSGANQMDGLVLDVSDSDSKLDQARKSAFEDARRKAEIYAAAAGARLGRVMDVREDGGARPMPQTMRANFAEAKAGAPVPIAPGEREIEVNVTVTWELES
jgi:uncharacterized protein YggE